MTDLNDDIVNLYDDYIRQAEDGVKVADAREAIRPDVMALLAGTERDLEGEATRLIEVTVRTARGKRSRSLRKQLEYILDGFEEDGTYVDPLLDQAYGLGDEHGIDKTLRYWQVEDFANLVVTRYRVAADATKAAREIDDVAQRCIDWMRMRGAIHFGDVA